MDIIDHMQHKLYLFRSPKDTAYGQRIVTVQVRRGAICICCKLRQVWSSKLIHKILWGLLCYILQLIKLSKVSYFTS